MEGQTNFGKQSCGSEILIQPKYLLKINYGKQNLGENKSVD